MNTMYGENAAICGKGIIVNVECSLPHFQWPPECYGSNDYVVLWRQRVQNILDLIAFPVGCMIMMKIAVICLAKFRDTRHLVEHDT